MNEYFHGWRRKAGVTALGLALVMMVCAIGFAVVLMAEGRAYYRQYLKERDLIAPIIATDASFSHVKIHQRSDGGVSLSGEVSSNADFQSLKEQLIKELGDRRGLEAVIAVAVKHREK